MESWSGQQCNKPEKSQHGANILEVDLSWLHAEPLHVYPQMVTLFSLGHLVCPALWGIAGLLGSSFRTTDFGIRYRISTGSLHRKQVNQHDVIIFLHPYHCAGVISPTVRLVIVQ